MSVWEMLFNGKFPFGNDSNGKWSFKSGTYFYTPIFPASVPMAQVVTGMVFRGEWNPLTKDYVAQNVVFIRAGSNAGAFICLQAAPDATHPPTNPDTGNEYWMAWPGSFPLGQWM